MSSFRNGHVRLGVHIADVGHYVRLGTALDREAFARGTSVYLPGRVLPMLPEQLCNGVCSLRPNEDKFTMTALMEIDDAGRVVDERIARTITCSKARLVYDDVNALFNGSEQQADAMAAVADTLYQMRVLAESCARAAGWGCIDFEIEEPGFVLDENGEPVEIITRERGEAEMMIEDFMLAANECVARFERENRLPLLYRVHEKPDAEKLAMFADFLDGISVNAKGHRHNAAPGICVSARFWKTKERRELFVITALASACRRARYDVAPLGRYGLAMADYCHFTSPIRRYPDLVVSRALTAKLTGQPAHADG
ncbi:MAG: RNB domain-containing ribonuclease [Christensenellales bacterium]